METTGAHLELQAVCVTGQKVTMALQRLSHHKWDEVNNKQTSYGSRCFCCLYAPSVLVPSTYGLNNLPAFIDFISRQE